MTMQISKTRLIVALLVAVIGISLVAVTLGSDKADAVGPSQDRVAVSSTRAVDRTTLLRRGVAPWNLPAHLKGASCGYLNPYTGNMGACLLKRGGVAAPRPTRADRQIISCAGQGVIAAAASLIVTPIGAPAVVAAASTLASCAWATLLD